MGSGSDSLKELREQMGRTNKKIMVLHLGLLLEGVLRKNGIDGTKSSDIQRGFEEELRRIPD